MCLLACVPVQLAVFIFDIFGRGVEDGMFNRHILDGASASSIWGAIFCLVQPGQLIENFGFWPLTEYRRSRGSPPNLSTWFIGAIIPCWLLYPTCFVLLGPHSDLGAQLQLQLRPLLLLLLLLQVVCSPSRMQSRVSNGACRKIPSARYDHERGRRGKHGDISGGT